MDGKAPPQRISKGLSKSNSNAGSIKSHDSVSVLGAYPLGTLRVHQPGDSKKEDEELVMDEDEGPPPLEPSADGNDQTLHASSQLTRAEKLSHRMGGGDVVLILDLPELFTVGYDTVFFTVKHFGGVRDIPSGAHFFWVAHPSGFSTRSGFWINAVGADNVHVMQWDKFNEVLSEPARAEGRIQADDLDAIHAKLIPYRDPSAANAQEGQLTEANMERNLEMWRQLTFSVDDRVLERLIGGKVDAFVVHTTDRVRGAVLMAAEVELDKKVPSSFLASRELNFSFAQYSRTWTTEQKGADRTLGATDSTSYILSMLDDPKTGATGEDMIGEFQFAYVVGMHLGNDACLQQWWYMLLKIILRAYMLPLQQPSIVEALLRALTAQITHSTEWLDGSIFDHSESQNKDLRLAFTVYKRRLNELLDDRLGQKATPAHLHVGTAFSKLEATLAHCLDWDISGDYLRKGTVMMEDGEQVELEVTDLEAEDERGEWAPEVVQLDDEGRQTDLVSWKD